jgi:hypothetical protein
VESEIQAALRVRASELGGALWRNNQGACTDKKGRVVRYGLGNASARLSKVWTSVDLIGLTPSGRFLAVEVKDRGWTWTGTERERAQAAFMRSVAQLGGLAGFAASPADLEALLAAGASDPRIGLG